MEYPKALDALDYLELSVAIYPDRYNIYVLDITAYKHAPVGTGRHKLKRGRHRRAPSQLN